MTETLSNEAHIPVTQIVDPCFVPFPTVIPAQGEIHILVATTTDGTRIYQNSQGIQGSLLGVSYTASDESKNFFLSTGQTGDEYIKVIRQGESLPMDDLFLHLHFDSNAPLSPTVSYECK